MTLHGSLRRAVAVESDGTLFDLHGDCFLPVRVAGIPADADGELSIEFHATSAYPEDRDIDRGGINWTDGRLTRLPKADLLSLADHFERQIRDIEICED